jgi:hypothetical protein
VEVQGEHAARDAGVVERLDDVVDAARRRDADRVADGDLVDGQVEQLVDDLAHRLGRDVSLVRAAERRRDVTADADPLLARARDDGRKRSIDSSTPR